MSPGQVTMIATASTLLGVAGSAIALYSQFEKRVASRTQIEMRLQAVEDRAKNNESKVWLLELQTLPQFDAKIDALEEEIEADRLANARRGNQ